LHGGGAGESESRLNWFMVFPNENANTGERAELSGRRCLRLDSGFLGFAGVISNYFFDVDVRIE